MMKMCYTSLALVVYLLIGCAPSQQEIAASCKDSEDVQKCVEQNKAQLDKDLNAISPKP